MRDVIQHPSHPYTEGLMASIPSLDVRVDRLRQIDGAMPRLTAIPPGCPYNPRCPKVFDRCLRDRPGLMPARGTEAACWLYDPATAEAAHTGAAHDRPGDGGVVVHGGAGARQADSAGPVGPS